MERLNNWPGKADELTIVYDVGVQKDQKLIESAGFGGGLPAIIYPENDNIREVAEVVWEENAKKAERVDYMMAICCGTIAGLFDVFFVGEFSIERANKWGNDEVTKFVKKVAKLQGFKGDDLSDAIKYMEQKHKFAADGVMPEFGGPLQHHLRDFSHHFSIGGWVCSLFTQFTCKVIGTDTSGSIQIIDLKDKTLIGKNFEEKILFGTINWFFHMVSDMAGSNATPGKGAGIPGPVLSLIKELSALPCFRNKEINNNELRVWISKLFNGTLLAKRDENGKIIKPLKFDLRTEIGILHEAERQLVPVLINECLVRGMYFLRRFYRVIKKTQIHSIHDFNKINHADLLPFNNRIIRRMITMASGTFTAIDTVDATINAVIKSKGINPTFFVNFAVRINIVGIARFIIACKADGQYIFEDIREAKKQRDSQEKQSEKILSDLKVMALNYDQMRVLDSLESIIIADDIVLTKKDEERMLKIEWKAEWEKRLTKARSLVPGTSTKVFLTESEIINYINENSEGPWLFLLMMEAMLFVPYYEIFSEVDKNNRLKKFKFKSKYLTNEFTSLQNRFTKDDFTILQKAYKRSIGIVTGSTKNVAVGAIGTTIAIVAVGGLAFAFAPAIATALVGEAAGLSGAALTSYSLAAIGGGSLAAGGLGMAGGTAIITGGGALIGMLGGTGISAATTVALLANDGYVLSECCKLITFSDVVLVEKYKRLSEVAKIQIDVESRIEEIQYQIDLYTVKTNSEIDDNKKKEMKRTVNEAKKSIKYLSRTAEELGRVILK